MVHRDTAPFTVARRCTVVALAAMGLCLARAQTTIVPQSVSASLVPFSPLSVASNLSLGITTSTGVTTTFPYSPNASFNPGIGYVSEEDQTVGSITYDFTDPISISRMLVWNAYFNFELDHSMRNVQLVFRNAANAVITTETFELPIANAGVLTPHTATLSTEVLGVKRVEIHVNTVWGGNEISVRRIAFQGNGLLADVADAQMIPPVLAYPNPATDRAVLQAPGIRSVLLLDAAGRSVPVDVRYTHDRAELSWGSVPHGIYTAVVIAPEGVLRARVVVGF